MPSDSSIPLVRAFTAEEVLPPQAIGKKSEKNIPSAPVILFPWQARMAIFVLFALFVTIGATYYWIESSPDKPAWAPAAMTTLWLISGTGASLLMFWVWREFARFGTDLSHWVNSLHEGYLSERMPVRNSFCPSYHLRNHLNTIAIDYQQIAGKLERRLKEQAQYLKQKEHYLSVLHDVASSINKSHSLDGLLNRFLLTLKKVVNAEGVTVKLTDENNKAHKVITIGDEFLDDEELIIIPIQYRNQMIGVFNISVDKELHPKLEDEHELLLSIGQHLGMAIKKMDVDSEAKLLSIMEERTRMAHELHDSLAQTLASMRYKVRLLDDSLNSEDEESIWTELEGLETIIEEANNELRSLMKDFRAPFDGSGVVRSIERIAKKFEMETGIELFFHKFWNLKEIPKEIEIEVSRIVQEALANIRKHSKAKTVPILMYSTEKGDCKILVEDDGVGMNENHSNVENDAGEHIGLSVMKERAARINGEIQFESEEGEGTLVQLSFMSTPEEELVSLS